MDDSGMPALAQAQEDSAQHPRPKVTNACEACRAAKVRCQASNQLGICRRCLESKRECIFKTGPRTRRPRQSKLANPSVPRPPPPPGPSKTFTIDIPLSAEEDPVDDWEALRARHEAFFDDMVPYSSDAEEDENCPPASVSTSLNEAESMAGSGISGSSLPLGASATHTPPSSVAYRASGKRSVNSLLGLQPQFNVDSAELLLKTFRGPMLSHFPCIVFHPDETVASLSRTRPFVLLAVLATASSSGSLQGHSLYDEEFRKVLGLKFVADGERTLELLQALIVYVAWYPFHLRPKSRQAFQYLRMAVDIIHDLELDQENDSDDHSAPPSEQRLEEIRAYVAAYHVVCTFGIAWNRASALKYSPHVTHCCNILQTYGTGQPDVVLSWLVRVQRIIEEAGASRRKIGNNRNNEAQLYQHALLVKGMDAELNDWARNMPIELSSLFPIRLCFLMAHIFLAGAPLLRISHPKKGSIQPFLSSGMLSQDLKLKLPKLKELYSLFLTQTAASLCAFNCICWSYMVVSIVLGFRVSFPLPEFEDWDDAAVRRELGFESFLEQMCQSEELGDDTLLAPATPRKNINVLDASRIVMRALLRKYKKRMAKIDRIRAIQAMVDQAIVDGGRATHPPIGDAFMSADPMQLDSSMIGCPMIDGTLDAYYPLWDESFVNTAAGAGMGGPSANDTGSVHATEGPLDSTNMLPLEQGLYYDLWATMTNGWSTERG